MQVKNQQLEPDMEQQTGSKLGKEYVKAVYCVELLNVKLLLSDCLYGIQMSSILRASL